MKERPILFSGPMVRAILDGRKTQTRRAYKTRRHPDFGCEIAASELVLEPQHVVHRACPYGMPGDRLWVRESFQPLLAEGVAWGKDDYETGIGYATSYAATDGRKEYYDYTREEDSDRLTPGIHMPRWASRITLELTDVRVERLQDISYDDAAAEGCATEADRFEPLVHSETWEQTARRLCWPQRSFKLLWNKINGHDSWDANPWVWVLSFGVISAPGKSPTQARDK